MWVANCPRPHTNVMFFKLAASDDTAMATRLQTSSAALGLRQPRHVITSGSVCVLISSLATPPGCCRSPASQTWCSLRRARESVLRPSLASVNHPTSRAQITVSESAPTARSHTCAKARPLRSLKIHHFYPPTPSLPGPGRLPTTSVRLGIIKLLSGSHSCCSSGREPPSFA